MCVTPLPPRATPPSQGFSSEQCPEGFVAVVKNTLRILSVDNVGETFNQSISRLRYTPRRLLVHPDYKTLIVAESDYQAVPIADNPELQKRLVVSVFCVCVCGGGGGVWWGGSTCVAVASAFGVHLVCRRGGGEGGGDRALSRAFVTVTSATVLHTICTTRAQL